MSADRSMYRSSRSCVKTVTTNVEYEYPEETVVTKEDIHTLDLLGIEKAQSILKEKNDTKYKFYCVG